MTRLEWGTAGERIYETGVDRGVLYVDGVGVPWNGLVSVTEEVNGGDAKPFYQDGVKYSNRAAAEEFQATISAFTYPDEFGVCDGSAPIGWGLFAMQQRRRSFSFCYRTRVGNDINGSDYGYKLHLIYDALAAPTQRTNISMGSDVTAANFSWSISVRPQLTNRLRPTSHFVIDSRVASDTMMQAIEDILYGTELSPPRIIGVDELIYRFEVDATGFYDSGVVGTTQYITLDGGHIPELQASTMDGGTP